MHNKGKAHRNIRGKYFKPREQLTQSPWGGNQLGMLQEPVRSQFVWWLVDGVESGMDKIGRVSGQSFSALATLALRLDHSL